MDMDDACCYAAMRNLLVGITDKAPRDMDHRCAAAQEAQKHTELPIWMPMDAACGYAVERNHNAGITDKAPMDMDAACCYAAKTSS
jgi:hypothetical protein